MVDTVMCYRLAFIFITILFSFVSLLSFAAKAWGQTTPTGTLVALSDVRNNQTHLILEDLSRHLQINLGCGSYGLPLWDKGKLVFVSNCDGNQEVYVCDGGATVDISQSPAIDSNPIWETGGQVVFLSDR